MIMVTLNLTFIAAVSNHIWFGVVGDSGAIRKIQVERSIRIFMHACVHLTGSGKMFDRKTEEVVTMWSFVSRDGVYV